MRHFRVWGRSLAGCGPQWCGGEWETAEYAKNWAREHCKPGESANIETDRYGNPLEPKLAGGGQEAGHYSPS